MTRSDFQVVTRLRRWRSVVRDLLATSQCDQDTLTAFAEAWIEAGAHIREQVGDDSLLVRLLRMMLPPYRGGSIRLFRGENIDRFAASSIGLAWTPMRGTAEMFGRGHNAVESGGVLLSAVFPPASVISGPVAHSEYLGEDQYTVDPTGVEIECLERSRPLG